MATSARAVPPQPVAKTYDTATHVQQEFENVYKQFQPLNFRIMSTAPNVAQISEGQIILFDDGANRKIYTKINGSVRSVALA
jgi:hypothetical protein